MAKKLSKMNILALEILANWSRSQPGYLIMPRPDRLTRLLDMGYVEQLENVHTGFKAFRITPAGLAAIGQDTPPAAEIEKRHVPQLLATRTETGWSVKDITEPAAVSRTLADDPESDWTAIAEATIDSLKTEDELRNEIAALKAQAAKLRRDLSDLAMLEGTTDAGEQAQRREILIQYE